MKKCMLFVSLALAGCSAAPISFQGVAPPGRQTAYDCAVAQLNILDYTIEDGNSDAGFVRGRRQNSGLGTQILTGSTFHDVLTASVFDNPVSGETNLRVVVTQIADHDSGGFFSGEPEEGEDVIEPSESGIADARALLANCGVSNIMGSSGSPEAEQYLLEGTTLPS